MYQRPLMRYFRVWCPHDQSEILMAVVMGKETLGDQSRRTPTDESVKARSMKEAFEKLGFTDVTRFVSEMCVEYEGYLVIREDVVGIGCGKYYVYRMATNGYAEYLTSLHDKWSHTGNDRFTFDTREQAEVAIQLLKEDPVLGPPTISRID